MVARHSRLKSWGKFLVTCVFCFPHYKMKLKIPALPIVMMIKPVFSALVAHEDFPGSLNMPMPGFHPDQFNQFLEGRQA